MTLLHKPKRKYSYTIVLVSYMQALYLLVPAYKIHDSYLDRPLKRRESDRIFFYSLSALHKLYMLLGLGDHVPIIVLVNLSIRVISV